MKFLFLALLALPVVATAQTARTSAGVSLMPEAQLEIALPGNDHVWLRLNGVRVSDDASADRQLGFDQGLVGAGYEHFWNERWSWGATATYGQPITTHYFRTNIVTPGLLLRHRSSIGSFTFGQRLGLEYTLNPPTLLGSDNYPDRTLVRLRLDVEKSFPLKAGATDGVSLRPRLSFEPLAFVQLQRDEDTPESRTIDFTALRAEIGCRLSPRVDFTPWFAFSTKYYYTLPQYDAMTGKQVGGGNVNQRTPLVGLDLRFTLLPNGDAVGREQLPTQH